MHVYAGEGRAESAPNLGNLENDRNFLGTCETVKGILIHASDYGDESDDDPDEHPLTLAETAEAQIQLKRASRATPDDGGLRALSDRRDLGITATDDALPGGAQKTYFLGIIDVLIKYNAKKRAETFVKTFKAKREAISSVPPDEYAARFLRFCEDVVLKDAEAK